MLHGNLLPLLCLWADNCGHESWGSVLRRKLLRRLLFVLPSDHADTNRRSHSFVLYWIDRRHVSALCCIVRASAWHAVSLPDEVRNQKEAQHPGQ
jgi:hypothetical protein